MTKGSFPESSPSRLPRAHRTQLVNNKESTGFDMKHSASEEQSHVKVSVCMTTYNHEPYIRQAVESVMGQQTSFPVELVVGEDCSTDRTREILLELREQYPDRLRLMLHERNGGPMNNFITTFNAARGEYVAFLDGDDYWTSSEKLQQQVQLLDEHPDVALCGHRCQVVSCARDEPGRSMPAFECRSEYTFAEFLAKPFLHISTVMARKSLPEVPSWFRDLKIGDLPLMLLLARPGNVAYLAQTMSVYRYHGGGIWSGNQHERNIRELIRSVRAVTPVLERAHRRINRVRVANLTLWLAECERNAGRTARGKRLALKSLWEHPLGLDAFSRSRIRRLLGILAPKSFNVLRKILLRRGGRLADSGNAAL